MKSKHFVILSLVLAIVMFDAEANAEKIILQCCHLGWGNEYSIEINTMFMTVREDHRNEDGRDFTIMSWGLLISEEFYK